MFHENLQDLFLNVTLEYCDSPGKVLLDSSEFNKIGEIVPEWAKIIRSGLDHDKEETYRTIRHVFRSLWVYYAILNEKYESNVDENHLNSLRNRILKINEFYSEFFPELHP